MGEDAAVHDEIRLLQIRIRSLQYERDELLAAERRLPRRQRLLRVVGRLAIGALWIVGAASLFVLTLWFLLMSGIIRMGPG